MTEAEKQEIVGLVMTQISSQAVDFDIATEEPKANDLLTAVRETESGGYRGVTIKWDDVARIATELANQAAKRAEDAKASIVASEENVNRLHGEVQGMKTSVEQMQSDVSGMKETVVAANNSAVNAANAASSSESNANTYMQNAQQAKSNAETAQGKAETAQGLAESAKQSAESAMGSAKTYMESAKQSAQESRNNVERFLPIDFRVTDPNKVILDVDVTGTMEAFVDGMEQEPNEAIALTLEPDVPTVGSHNFGVRGQICIDGNYLYVCVADNTWKKIALQEL